MERRGKERDEELGMGNSKLNSISMGYMNCSGSGSGPPMAMIHQESQPLKQLPLAPTILSSNPSDYLRLKSPNHPLIHPSRRGSSIFSPNSQALIQPHNNPPPPPPPPPLRENPSPDPDPPPSSTKTPTAVSPPPETPTAGSGSGDNNNPLIKYRECLKNHAASMGSHVVDGCGEFMPSGDAGTAVFFRCAACDCHRNFHRKEVEGNLQSPSQPHPQPLHYPFNNPNPANTAAAAAAASTYSMPPHLRHRHKQTTQGSAPPAIVNFGGSSGGESSSEDLNMFQSGSAAAAPNSKKRFRTKFRQDQKERMQEFAAKLGWRIQKENEEELQQFCNEVGVNRQVFKVWMHNNKQPIKKPHI